MYFFIFVGFFGIISLSLGQDPRHAAILTDARYLAGDGTFGSAYTQEDGVQFKEVSDANGDRRGSYSYVDPNGHRRTVEYTAGKNGFQPIGEGIPKVTLPTSPTPGYEPLPEYNPPEYQSQSEPHHIPQSQSSSQPQSPPRSYQYQTEPQYVRQSLYQSRPTPAFQSAYRPRYQNEYDVNEYQSRTPQRSVVRQQRILASHNSPQAQSQYQSVDSQHQPEAQYGPHIEYSFNTPSQSIYREYQPEYNGIPTPSPQKYYSPGKLDFTRTPDGFSYIFTKS